MRTVFLLQISPLTRSKFRLWVACVALSLTSASVPAAEDQPLDPPQSYIVVTAAAPIMKGDSQAGSLPLGNLFLATRANGNWRYSREERGWAHLRDLIPVNEAILKFTRELEAKPTARAYQLRGIGWMSQEEWARAAQDFEQAYDLGESAIALHLNLGTCYQRLGQLPAAMHEYDTILNTYPDDPSALLARGNLQLQQGQYSAALRDLSQASKLNPASADAVNAQGVALRMLGRFDEAIVAYDAALKIDPARADSLSNRGYARKNLADLVAAHADYEAAAKLAPDSPAIRNDLAWLLATADDAELRDGQRAVEIAEQVCQQTKNENGEYLDTLAAAYACAGRFPAAIETARLAIQVLGPNPGADKTRERLELYLQQQPYIEPRSAPAKVIPASEDAAVPEATPVKPSEPQ